LEVSFCYIFVIFCYIFIIFLIFKDSSILEIMVEYRCRRCGWISKVRTHFRKHLMRKFRCNPIVEDIEPELLLDELDGKIIEIIETKTEKPKVEEKKFDIIITKLEKQNQEIVEARERENSLTKAFIEAQQQWKNEREALHEEITKLLEKVGNNNTNYNQYNIQLNAFGHENLSYLKKDLLTQLCKIPYTGVQRLISHIHFSEEHPENKNIKITNKKDKYAMQFNGKDWEYVPKKQMLEDMIDKGFNILEDHFDSTAKEELDETKQERFEKFAEEIGEADSEIRKSIALETECLILNHSKVD
jgi:hypothetical protein